MKISGFVLLMMFFLIASPRGFSMPSDPVASQTASFQAAGREVSVHFAWLERPGEFSLTVNYWGPLTQEGPVNLWIRVNGVAREFITLHELPNRRQTVRLLSFQALDPKRRESALIPLSAGEVVDSGLFAQAAYESDLGPNHVEFIFFAHGRWDGNPLQNNANYTCTFTRPASS